ncbi:Melanopsin like protein [Argiope bruennichi]|uniref:Melanopsin like protein n=1 Tax=Argiope bruennichi TaxID=94029 RepID=A0A8T0ELJ8_ARGBR|nr:Melanopsin like protein [Argiope bruennichi]
MSILNQSDYVLDNLTPSNISQYHDYATPLEKEDLSPFGYAVAAVCLFFIMVFGCFFNFVVIIVVGGTRKLRTPMNAILLNLSISDFAISFLGTPMSFASAVNRDWLFGPILCEVYAFCMTLTGKLCMLSTRVLVVEPGV